MCFRRRWSCYKIIIGGCKRTATRLSETLLSLPTSWHKQSNTLSTQPTNQTFAPLERKKNISRTVQVRNVSFKIGINCDVEVLRHRSYLMTPFGRFKLLKIVLLRGWLLYVLWIPNSLKNLLSFGEGKVTDVRLNFQIFRFSLDWRRIKRNPKHREYRNLL